MITDREARAAWREFRAKSEQSHIVPPDVVDMLDEWAVDDDGEQHDDGPITAKWLESIGGVHEAGMVDDYASVWSDGWYMFDIGHKYRWLAVSVHENEIEIQDVRPCGSSAVITFPVKSRRSVVDLLNAFRGLAVSK